MAAEKRGAAEEARGLANALPSTGFDFVDVALLACASALIGKSIALLAWLVMAGVALRIERKSGYFGKVNAALADYESCNGLEPNEHDMDVTELAAAHVAVKSPTQHRGLELINASAILAYSASLLVVIYAWALHRMFESPWHWFGVTVCAALFAVLGCVQQLDYYSMLGVSIAALRLADDRPSEGS